MGTEEENRELSEILSTVSHELRSPVSAVKGYLSAINDGVVPEGDVKKYIGIALSETDRVIELLENIMHLSKLAAGAAKPVFATFDINELIRLAIIEKINNIEKKDTEVITDLAPEKIFVSADRGMIMQVLLNLIDNGVKYGNNNGKLILSASVEGKKAVITCRDNGKGIDELTLPHIFERFYQADKSSASYCGHGLGLPLVKEILLLHSSELSVETEVGKGTAFTFSLDLA